MPVIVNVEQIFCICGPLERKCSYCDRIFRVNPHSGSDTPYLSNKMSNSLAFNIMFEHCDWIKCIFCGSLTWPRDNIKRSKEEIKVERRSPSNG